MSRVLFTFSNFLYTLSVTVIGYILIGLFACSTFLSHIGITAGIILLRQKTKRLPVSGGTADRKSHTPLLSVIVPARNEEQNLPRLFTSLEHQFNHHFEIVFINDRSEDNTPFLLDGFKKKHGGRVRIVTIADHPDNSGLNPKQYALAQGIKYARGEILLFTDADCTVPREWTERMSTPFTNPRIGLCLGPIQTEGLGQFIYRYQFFDHIFRYFYTAGSAGIGLPTGGFGNNLAVRSQALKECGGYESIGYSVTEDAALVVAIRDRTSYAITAAISEDSAVQAMPQDQWKDLSKQERRWSYGAFQSPDVKTVFGYAAVMLFLFAGLAAIPLTFAFRPFFLIIISTFTSMLLVAVSGGICLRCGFRKYWLFLLPSIFFSSLFYTFNNILSFFNIPITWKGKDLDKM